MANTTLINRALIRLSGDDVRGFLQGLVTNDTSGDLPVWAALLSAQGKALFDFLIWADGDDILIDCERDAAGDLAKRLTLYRLRRAITIEPEPDLCVHWAAPDGAGGDVGVAARTRPALAGPGGRASRSR
jgi:tRNA-modifying protein YgfZ